MGIGMGMGEHRSLHGHIPAMLGPVLDGLGLRPDGCYADCTYGRGGHSAAILARLGAAGRLLAFDKDPEAARHGQRRFADDPRFRIVRASFCRLTEVAAEEGRGGRVDGVLFDLGVSLPQLLDAARGFGLRQDGALDMRMDPSQGQSAADWIARATEREMARVFREYGEERYARRVARAIVAARRQARIQGCVQLADIIRRAMPAGRGGRGGRGGRHPATRCFQAIRIHINRELDELREGLEQAAKLLAPGGRLAVISFHSLEDRIVKRFLRERRQAEGARLLPVAGPLRPDPEEVTANPRCRSAVLRVAGRER